MKGKEGGWGDGIGVWKWERRHLMQLKEQPLRYFDYANEHRFGIGFLSENEKSPADNCDNSIGCLCNHIIIHNNRQMAHL